MKKVFKYAGIALLVCLVLLAVTVGWVLSWPEFGGSVEGERLERARNSPQWKEGQFENDPPPPSYDLMVNLDEMMGDQVRQPPAPFPAEDLDLSGDPEPGLRAAWFGHATVYVEIDGRRVMTDPMLSKYAFPVHAFAPTRFNPPPVRLDELPDIDVVTISHDHFDHLDMRTVKALADGGAHFFFGLGVGAHFERWGIPSEQLHEMDWWETEEHAGLEIHCTPARHYSGRKSMSNPTLWSSWVVEGPDHRIYHSGDSGYAPHFAEIKKKRGPIDIAFIKIGDYGKDAAWESIHMVPEDSIRAHVDLGAKIFFPIHWGTFELSYHAWNEPIRRAEAAAAESDVTMVTPPLGDVFEFGESYENTRWWEDLADPRPDDG